MKNTDTKLFTIGELARRCGVTVRTLQYYDKEGLISPSHYTEGGRRLYDRDDIMLLHQILFLKSFGFSLSEIRDRLLRTDSPGEIAQLFSRQRDILREQIENLQEVVGMLDNTISEIDMNGDLGTEKLVAIMGMMKQKNPYSFIFRYFDTDDMKSILNKFNEVTETDAYAAEWADISAEMVSLYQKGADPKGPEGQALAAKWWAQVQKLTEDDPALLQTMIDAGNDVDNWPDQAGDIKLAARDFLSQAFDTYLKDIGVMPEGNEEHE